MKFWNYIMLFTTVMLVLEFAGMETGFTSIFEDLGISFNDDNELTSADVGGSGLWDELFGITGALLTIAATAGIIIVGLLSRSQVENYVLLPVTIWITTLFIGTIGLIIKSSLALGQAWMGALLGIILIPLGVGFIVSAAEFFRASD